jgi:hypothetical protein
MTDRDDLGGRPLFPGAGRAELLGAILSRTPAPPKSINPNLSDSLDRTIAPRAGQEPTSRPPSAADLRGALAQRGDLPRSAAWRACGSPAGLEQAATTGLPCYPWFARDPLLDPLRRDPQFVEFMSGLEDAWRKRIVRYTSGTR